MKPDRVLTINDYYDGPRLGIAEVDGIPHVYESEFDHSSDDYGDTYFVSPVDPELASLVLEDYAIYSRWAAAFKRKEVTVESHPALPRERPRHEELLAAIGDRLRTDPENRRYFKATFDSVEPVGDWGGTTVAWVPLPVPRLDT